MLTGKTKHGLASGLASILQGQCSICSHKITLETSPKVRGARGYPQWECNVVAAVWGEMVTGGGGHSRLEETLGVLGVPVMTKCSFISTERGIGDQRRKGLEQSMVEAGREERWLATERGDSMKTYLQSPSQWTVAGVNVLTSILIMLNPVSPSSLVKRQGSCYT